MPHGNTSPKVVTEVKKVKMPAPRDSKVSTWLKTSPTNEVGMFCCTCRQVFSVFTWKHTCRRCGRCFCSKCSTKASVSSATGEGEKMRMCFPCRDEIDKPSDAQPNGNELSETAPSQNEPSENEPSASAADLNLPPRYLNSPLSKVCQAPPPRRSEEALLEDDDEQLARAIVLSELPMKVKCGACGQVISGTFLAKTSKIPAFGIEQWVLVCDSCFERINGPPDQQPPEGERAQSQPSNFAAPSNVPPGRANGPLSERSGGVGTSGTDSGQNQRNSTAGDGNSQVARDNRADIKKADNDGIPTSKLDEELQCPLCLDMLDKATTLGCGHTFCAGCLVEVHKVAKKCPLCRKPIVTATRSVTLDNIISSIVGNR